MPKSSLRSFLISLASLQAAITVIPGLTNKDGWQTLVFATVVLALINFLVRPIISLLLLPINLLTLGAFRWVGNIVVIYLLTLVISDLSLTVFTFPGVSYKGFIIPQMEISRFLSLVLVALTIGLTQAFLNWLTIEAD